MDIHCIVGLKCNTVLFCCSSFSTFSLECSFHLASVTFTERPPGLGMSPVLSSGPNRWILLCYFLPLLCVTVSPRSPGCFYWGMRLESKVWGFRELSASGFFFSCLLNTIICLSLYRPCCFHSWNFLTMLGKTAKARRVLDSLQCV